MSNFEGQISAELTLEVEKTPAWYSLRWLASLFCRPPLRPQIERCQIADLYAFTFTN